MFWTFKYAQKDDEDNVKENYGVIIKSKSDDVSIDNDLLVYQESRKEDHGITITSEGDDAHIDTVQRGMIADNFDKESCLTIKTEDLTGHHNDETFHDQRDVTDTRHYNDETFHDQRDVTDTGHCDVASLLASMKKEMVCDQNDTMNTVYFNDNLPATIKTENGHVQSDIMERGHLDGDSQLDAIKSETIRDQSNVIDTGLFDDSWLDTIKTEVVLDQSDTRHLDDCSLLDKIETEIVSNQSNITDLEKHDSHIAAIENENHQKCFGNQIHIMNRTLDNRQKVLQNRDLDNTQIPLQNRDLGNTQTPLQNRYLDNTLAPLQNRDLDNTLAPLQNRDLDNTQAALQNRDLNNTQASLQNMDLDNTQASLQNMDLDNTQAPLQIRDLNNTKALLQNRDLNNTRTPLQNRVLDNTWSLLQNRKLENSQASLENMDLDNTQAPLQIRDLDNKQLTLWERNLVNRQVPLQDKNLVNGQVPFQDRNLVNGHWSLQVRNLNSRHVPLHDGNLGHQPVPVLNRNLYNTQKKLQGRNLDNTQWQFQDMNLDDRQVPLQGRNQSITQMPFQDRNLDKTHVPLQNKNLGKTQVSLQDRNLGKTQVPLQDRNFNNTEVPLQERNQDKSHVLLQDKNLDNVHVPLQDNKHTTQNKNMNIRPMPHLNRHSADNPPVNSQTSTLDTSEKYMKIGHDKFLTGKWEIMMKTVYTEDCTEIPFIQFQYETQKGTFLWPYYGELNKFQCFICGKAIKRSNLLPVQKHLMSHISSDQHLFNVGNIKYTESEQLLLHIKTHTGDGPYNCDICGHAFNELGQRWTPGYRNSQGQYVPFEESIIKPRYKSNGDPSYYCEVCDKSFNSLKALIKHFQRSIKHTLVDNNKEKHSIEKDTVSTDKINSVGCTDIENENIVSVSVGSDDMVREENNQVYHKSVGSIETEQHRETQEIINAGESNSVVGGLASFQDTGEQCVATDTIISDNKDRQQKSQTHHSHVENNDTEEQRLMKGITNTGDVLVCNFESVNEQQSSQTNVLDKQIAKQGIFKPTDIDGQQKSEICLLNAGEQALDTDNMRINGSDTQKNIRAASNNTDDSSDVIKSSVSGNIQKYIRGTRQRRVSRTMKKKINHKKDIFKRNILKKIRGGISDFITKSKPIINISKLHHHKDGGNIGAENINGQSNVQTHDVSIGNCTSDKSNSTVDSLDNADANLNVQGHNFLVSQHSSDLDVNRSCVAQQNLNLDNNSSHIAQQSLNLDDNSLPAVQQSLNLDDNSIAETQKSFDLDNNSLSVAQQSSDLDVNSFHIAQQSLGLDTNSSLQNLDDNSLHVAQQSFVVDNISSPVAQQSSNLDDNIGIEAFREGCRRKVNMLDTGAERLHIETIRPTSNRKKITQTNVSCNIQHRSETDSGQRNDNSEVTSNKNKIRDIFESEAYEITLKEKWDRDSLAQINVSDKEAAMSRLKIWTSNGLMIWTYYGEQDQYRCDVCGKTYLTLAKVKHHVMGHIKSKKYTGISDEKYSESDRLRRHLMTHKEDNPDQCEVCGKAFNELGQRYIVAVNNQVCCQKQTDSETKKRSLYQCDGHTSKLRYHSDNFDKFHKFKKKETKKQDAADIPKTLKMLSLEAIIVQLCNTRIIDKKILQTGTEPCNICNITFSNQRLLEKHCKICPKNHLHNSFQDGVSVSIHKCDVCSKSFRRKSDLTKHLKIHSEKRPLECSVCQQKFIDRKTLSVHLRKHTGDKPYKCNVCGKAFRLVGCRARHMKVHTGKRLFMCHICGKGISSRSNLSQHLLTHTDKCFLCEICGTTFMCLKSFRKHHSKHSRVLTYTNEENLCDVCGKIFKSENKMLKHRKRHSEKYLCEICGKHMLTYVREHLRSHRGEKPFRCDICCKGFKRKYHLKMHNRVHTAGRHRNCHYCGRAFIDQERLRRHQYLCKHKQNVV